MPDDPGDETSPYVLTGFAPYGTADQATKPLEVAARLVCVGGPDVGTTHRLAPGANVIGRGEVAIRVCASEVSRQHARITQDGDTFVVEDLGATNRTRVNDREISSRTPVRFGDRIQIGSTIFVLAHHDELETRVQQLMRLDAMTAAVSGMAHDFNNVLHVIMSSVDELDAELPPDAAGWRQTLDDMRTAATSAASLSKRLVKLGRGGPLPNEVVDLGALAREVVAMARRVVDAKRITIQANVPAGVTVRGSRDELQQVLLNMCINARDAMPSGGQIDIDGGALEVDRTFAVARLLPREGWYVQLSVRDTGTGMSEATIERIFEPFFTTKASDRGTGLGLATSHVIVKRHGGTILVDSQLGVGTTFRILLPAAL